MRDAKNRYTVPLLFEEVVYSSEFQLAVADGNLQDHKNNKKFLWQNHVVDII